MRRAPSQALLEDLVQGKLLVIPGLDTALFEGQAEPCIAFRASEDEHSPPNAFANWLYFQAQLRKGKGFTEPGRKIFLKGTIVIISGDEPFMQSFIWGILLGTRKEDTPLPSELLTG